MAQNGETVVKGEESNRTDSGLNVGRIDVGTIHLEYHNQSINQSIRHCGVVDLALNL